jgi:hypothetical protein
MEEDHERTERSAQEEEAEENHLDWRCDHFHFGAEASKVSRQPALRPHRHTPGPPSISRQSTPDLLAGVEISWTIETAGANYRCRGIEVERYDPDTVGGWSSDAGNPRGPGEHVAARVRRWL